MVRSTSTTSGCLTSTSEMRTRTEQGLRGPFSFSPQFSLHLQHRHGLFLLFSPNLSHSAADSSHHVGASRVDYSTSQVPASGRALILLSIALVDLLCVKSLISLRRRAGEGLALWGEGFVIALELFPHSVLSSYRVLRIVALRTRLQTADCQRSLPG